MWLSESWTDTADSLACDTRRHAQSVTGTSTSDTTSNTGNEPALPAGTELVLFLLQFLLLIIIMPCL